MPSLGIFIAAALLLLVKAKGQLILAGERGKVKLELYNADRTTLIGPMVDGMVIDIATTPKLNIKGSSASSIQKLRLSSMSFFVDDKPVNTECVVPAWMLGDLDNAWTPTVGLHKITAVGHRRKEGKGLKMLESSVRVIVVDTRTKLPTLAPAKPPAASPFAAPIAAPVAPPVVAPIIPPTKLPVAKTKGPTKGPTKTPTKGPTKAPTKGYTSKAPTRRPTSAPTAAPTPCTSDVVKYINSITLSNQTLSVNGFSPLDQALLRLLVSNGRKRVRLSTCNEADRTRLRQRYAYFALVFSTQVSEKANSDNDNECKWDGLTCNQNGMVTELYFRQLGLTGSIPADVGLWTGLLAVTLEDNDLTGALPTTIALWTNISYFNVGYNKLSGVLPSSMGTWASLTSLDVSSNQYNGQLPSFVGAWANLYNFDISDNKFTGPLPASIGEWTSITYINIFSNGFSAPLPASIGAWTKLVYFYASQNKINGTVPNGVANWTSINEVNLAGNSLSGSIPTIGTNFCPKNISNGVLYDLRADCPQEVICVCCNFCCYGTYGDNCAPQ
jgi:hypothetical protein